MSGGLSIGGDEVVPSLASADVGGHVIRETALGTCVICCGGAVGCPCPPSAYPALLCADLTHNFHGVIPFVLRRMNTPTATGTTYVGAADLTPPAYPKLSVVRRTAGFSACYFEAKEEFDLVYVPCWVAGGPCGAYVEIFTTFQCQSTKYWIDRLPAGVGGASSCGNYVCAAESGVVCTPYAATLGPFDNPLVGYTGFTGGTVRETPCGPLPASFCQSFSSSIWLRVAGWNETVGGSFACSHGEGDTGIVFQLNEVANVFAVIGGVTFNYGPGWSTAGNVSVCGQLVSFHVSRPFAGRFMHGNGGCVLIIKYASGSPGNEVLFSIGRGPNDGRGGLGGFPVSHGINDWYDVCPLWQWYAHSSLTPSIGFRFETLFYVMDGDPNRVRVVALGNLATVPKNLTATVYPPDASGPYTVPLAFMWGQQSPAAYNPPTMPGSVIQTCADPCTYGHSNFNGRSSVLQTWYGTRTVGSFGHVKVTLEPRFDICTLTNRLVLGVNYTAVGGFGDISDKYVIAGDILSVSPLHIDAQVPGGFGGDLTRVVITE